MPASAQTIGVALLELSVINKHFWKLGNLFNYNKLQPQTGKGKHLARRKSLPPPSSIDQGITPIVFVIGFSGSSHNSHKQ